MVYAVAVGIRVLSLLTWASALKTGTGSAVPLRRNIFSNISLGTKRDVIVVISHLLQLQQAIQALELEGQGYEVHCDYRRIQEPGFRLQIIP
ncbi:MAG: hypothetical protein V8S96_02530 [Lachnospiraceae bacterium]